MTLFDRVFMCAYPFIFVTIACMFLSFINYFETWKHYHNLHIFLDKKYSYLNVE